MMSGRVRNQYRGRRPQAHGEPRRMTPILTLRTLYSSKGPNELKVISKHVEFPRPEWSHAHHVRALPT